MNFRAFALTFAASLILASGAGAAQHKHHPRIEDRQLSARSDHRYWQDDRSDSLPSTLNPLNRDPLTSANGA